MEPRDGPDGACDNGGIASCASRTGRHPVPSTASRRRSRPAPLGRTVGIASKCAPSNLPSLWAHIDGLQQFLAAGDVVVAPDYQGLGTRGPHPYLVGSSEARATLDEVRAAERFAPAHAGNRFVVWGVSQGGQVALFTGQEASVYAPELRLLGGCSPPTRSTRGARCTRS